MKRNPLFFGALWLGALTGIVLADPDASYDAKPLPPGPIVIPAPDFASWQITYDYGSDKTGQGSTTSSADDPANSPTGLPKMITMTRTRPLWHAVLVDMAGNKKETWYDGTTRFQVVGSQVIPSNAMSTHSMAFKDYFGGDADFPDIAWVSADNYLGTQKGTVYWVFREGPDGAMVWIDSSTHYPARWQQGTEVRTFQFLSPPTSSLVLPSNVAKMAQTMDALNRLSHAAPPHL
jgi:hypothetical protein